MDTSQFLPCFSMDCVVFGFHQNTLKVLLLEIADMGKWALPGGFVQKDEDIQDAAVRMLQERTSLDEIFLQQFYLFGKKSRYQPEYADHFLRKGLITETQYAFIQQRFVSLGYYALVEYSQVKTPRPDAFSGRCEWQPLTALPDLVIDHQEIVDRAYAQIRRDLRHLPIGKNLLPQRFTMSELRCLYETLLGQELDRRNFQRKMLAYGILRKTEERRKGGAHKSPYLYEFEDVAYEKALAEGLSGGW